MDDGTQATISVTGIGIATRQPDTVEISIGISLVRGGVAEATDEAATLANRLVEALRSQGLEGDDLQTTNYSVSTEYDHRNQPPRLTGYRVENSLRLTVRAIDTFPAVLAAATTAGGDATTISGITFSYADRDGLRVEARAAAWQRAVDAASQLAELAGRSLGPALHIVEGGSPSRPPSSMLTRSAMVESAVPIEGGTVDERVTLSVEFALA